MARPSTLDDPSRQAKALSLQPPKSLNPNRLNGGADTKLLADHPVGGCFLRLPSLEQLFGDGLQRFWIGGGVDGAAEALYLKLLTNREFHCWRLHLGITHGVFIKSL